MNLILFVAKIFLCSGILFSYYLLFLRNKRFHHYNRFYLLAIVIISLVFPFLEISISDKSQAPAVHQAIDLISVNNWEGNWNEEDVITTETKEPILTGRNLALFAYSIGLLLLLTLLIKSLYYIIRIRNKYNSEPIGDLKLYNTVEPGTPFSFFKSIFWNHQLSFNSKEGQQIFRHELFHVRQHHSSDALFMEIVCIICWFNPFFHLIRKELKAIHEFLADQYAISGNDRYAYAELLVLESMRQKKVSFVHPFFQNNIKRRIAMITQFNKTRYGYWSRVMALPILILLFCVITLKAQQKASVENPKEFEKSIQSITVLVDAGHGGKDPGAYSPDHQYAEKDIALAIAKKIKEKGPAYNVNVIMTRDDDNFPELKARTDQATQINADVLVSIHVGSEAPYVVKGQNGDKVFPRGLIIYNPRSGSPNETQSKLLSSALLRTVTPLYNTSSITSRKAGIWVIDKAPCPAVLIECGNIAHKPDLEFILKETNQEKIADVILKGIVAYKSSKDGKQARNTTEVEEVNAVTETATVVEESKPEERVQEMPIEEIGKVVETTKAETANGVYEEPIASVQDDIKKYLAQHFQKTMRYPEQGRQKNQVTSVYFAVELDKKGKIWNIDVFVPETPVSANVQDLVIVGSPGDKSAPIVQVKSKAHDIWEQELDKSIKSFEAPANSEVVEGKKYYFRAVFKLSNDISQADVNIEPVISGSVNSVAVQTTGANVSVSNSKNVSGKVSTSNNVQAKVNTTNNVQAKVSTNDPIVVTGYPLNSTNKISTGVNVAGTVSNTSVSSKQVNSRNSINNAVAITGVQSTNSKNSGITKFNGEMPVDLIRSFKVGETNIDYVKKELGDASNQFMDSYVESLAYYGTNERLMLTFSREDGKLINYSYDKDQRAKTPLNYDEVKMINKGSTSFKDVLKKFGKPSQIHIDNNTEAWLYESDNARLTILTNDKMNPVVHQMTFDSQNSGSKSQK